MPSKSEELRVMDEEELENRLNETRQELFNLRFQLVTGALDNTARISHVRRHVARIETVLREREIAEAEGIEIIRPVAAVRTPPAPETESTPPAAAESSPSPEPAEEGA